jgi:putative hydrolase of the HAD superfamily
MTNPATPPPAADPAPRLAIRAVWTDFGGVLTPSMRHTWDAFCARLAVDPRVLLDAVLRVTRSYGTDDIMEPLDTPLVSEREWLAQVGDVLRTEHGHAIELETLGDIWFDDRETDAAWAGRLRELRAGGLFVGVLSNMVPAWDPYWRRLLPIDEMFDDVVLSFRVGHRKPQPEIFALAAERAGVAPGECLLVDDLATNCAGAVAAGWHAIEYRDAAHAGAELAALLGGSSAGSGVASGVASGGAAGAVPGAGAASPVAGVAS